MEWDRGPKTLKSNVRKVEKEGGGKGSGWEGGGGGELGKQVK